MKLIEKNFPSEFIDSIAEQESWRKEINRPIYHIHKWWAKRLGSVFRAILLASILEPIPVLTRQRFVCKERKKRGGKEAGDGR